MLFEISLEHYRLNGSTHSFKQAYALKGASDKSESTNTPRHIFTCIKKLKTVLSGTPTSFQTK